MITVTVFMLQVLLMCLNVAEDCTLPTYMQKKISSDLYLNLNSDILPLTTEVGQVLSDVHEFHEWRSFG